jgi:hypothetical protein
MGAAKDRVGDAPGHESLHPSSPVCSHDDEVSPDFVSHAEDLFRGVPLPRAIHHVNRVTRDIHVAQLAIHGFVLSFIIPRVVELGDRLAEEDRIFRDEIRLQDMYDKDAGFVCDGQ